MLLTFWLAHVLLATAACNFWSAELQKVVRGRQFFFNILSCKCASRHSGAILRKMDREWCVFADFDYLQMSFLRQRRAILAPGARVRPSTNHWASYQPTIGHLTNQLLGILPTDGYVLGFCFTVLVLRLSFRVWF